VPDRGGAPAHLRGVIFDMDGVVVDSEPLSLLTIAEVVADRGGTADPSGLGDLVGSGRRPFIAAAEHRQRPARTRPGTLNTISTAAIFWKATKAMTLTLWANIILAVPFVLAIIGIPLWLTWRRTDTEPDHAAARRYLAVTAARRAPARQAPPRRAQAFR